VDDGGAEPLELRDQLDEQLLHEVEQRLAKRRVVQKGVRGPGVDIIIRIFEIFADFGDKMAFFSKKFVLIKFF
jgi:hypothetical protein